MNEASRASRSHALKCSGESTIPIWLVASGQDGQGACRALRRWAVDLTPQPWDLFLGKVPLRKVAPKTPPHTRWAELRKSVAANGAELCLAPLPRP